MGNSSTLWPIFFLSMFLAYLTDRCSRFEYGSLGEKKYLNQNKFFYIILAISMSVFIGLRIWCNDTGTYRDAYVYLTNSTGPLLEGISMSIGDSPGFAIVNTILKRLGFSSQDFLMFYAFLTISLYLWFIRKYSIDFWLSTFLYVTMGVYMFAAAGMRQAVAVAIALLGVDRGLQKKWIPFIWWIIIASTFHPYTVLFLFLPFCTFSPWSNKTWAMLGIFFVVGVTLQQLLGVVLSITSAMGKVYSDTEFSGEGVNIFRLLVVWAPIILSFLVKDKIRTTENEKRNLFINFSTLNAAIMFVALFGTANYFARLANYFLIFQALAVPWIIVHFKEKDRGILRIIIIGCYMLYFVFANVILTPFNTYFAKMSLWDYLEGLF